jgi:hypothetical protein
MRERTIAGIIAIIGGLLTVLILLVWVNPHANVPLISEVVCTIKGATWYDGDVFNQPGCYDYGGGIND